MVFQSYGLYPNMTVYENISFPLRIRGAPKEQIHPAVMKASAKVELDDFLQRRPKELSGGQRQRVALARAIVRQPEVFLMDEPLSNLDAKLRVSMRAHIKHLHHELGVTTIYVTHDQVEAMTLADRVVVMSKAEVQQIGTPEQIYNDPNNLFVAGFIGAPAMNLVRRAARWRLRPLPARVMPCASRVSDSAARMRWCWVYGPRTCLSRRRTRRRSVARCFRSNCWATATTVTLRLAEQFMTAKAGKEFRTDIGSATGFAVPPTAATFSTARRRTGCVCKPHPPRPQEFTMSFFTTRRTLLASAVLLATMPGVSHARCETLSNVKPGEINIVGNSFPALQHIAKEMQSCTQGGLKVQFKMTPQIQQEVQQAFGSAGKSAFDAAVVSMGVFADLQSKGQLQPITDLVNKYKAKYKIEDNMLIKVNGEVMAIAFMQNAQNLFYRKDLFDKHGLKAPASYADMIAAAEDAQGEGARRRIPDRPDLRQGLGQRDRVHQHLRRIRRTLLQARICRAGLQQRCGREGLRDDEGDDGLHDAELPGLELGRRDEPVPAGQGGHGRAVGHPGVPHGRCGGIENRRQDGVHRRASRGAGGRSATHLWWDGVVMPKNLGGDRETVFQVLMEALDEETTRSGNDLTIWIRSAYKPTRFGTGVSASAKAGAPIWPTEPYFGLAHGEIGKVLPDVMTGAMSPKQALDIAAAAYAKAATEKGFLK
jgi:ABC-type glycerol-3-phosphate transport system substrate-binding protein